jgi:hypothetical protein
MGLVQGSTGETLFGVLYLLKCESSTGLCETLVPIAGIG